MSDLHHGDGRFRHIVGPTNRKAGARDWIPPKETTHMLDDHDAVAQAVKERDEELTRYRKTASRSSHGGCWKQHDEQAEEINRIHEQFNKEKLAMAEEIARLKFECKTYSDWQAFEPERVQAAVAAERERCARARTVDFIAAEHEGFPDTALSPHHFSARVLREAAEALRHEPSAKNHD